MPATVLLAAAAAVTAPVWGLLLVLDSCSPRIDPEGAFSGILGSIGISPGALACAFRMARDAPPDLEFPPGREGHLPGLGALSTQRHYHVPGLGRTAIAIRIELGTLRGLAVRGTYPGEARAVRTAEVTPVPLPALVSVAAEPGIPRPELADADGMPVPDLTDLAVTLPDAPEPSTSPPPLAWGFPDGHGRTQYALPPGRWRLAFPGGGERWIEPGPLDVVRVDPDGHGGWAVMVGVGAGKEVVDAPEDRPR